jgi:LmbE family N-acetylglucosaminyl deacetylase
LARAKNRIEFLMVSFSNSDKVLVVAPHPDDESLGVGGLLQRIFAQKVPVRILFATNGDNNPWAQRYWERKWVIGGIERTRWGQRRREEALRAIGVLGGTSESAKFLNLPDLGTTDLLMKGAAGLSDRVAAEIREWQPTVALIPTMFDAHPDHSALSVAVSMALDSAEGAPIRALEYLVHKPKAPILQMPMRLLLSAEEVERKRRAILCHETQVALSRRRFTSFAKVEEVYFPHDRQTANDFGPLEAEGRLYEGVLRLQFKLSRGERFRSKILLAFRSGETNQHRWLLPLPVRSGEAQVWDTIRGQRLPTAIVRWTARRLSVEIPVSGTSEFDLVYAKFSGWTLFFDRSGWVQFSLLPSLKKNLVPKTGAEASRLVTLL